MHEKTNQFKEILRDNIDLVNNDKLVICDDEPLFYQVIMII
jgi:hypothetical protein